VLLSLGLIGVQHPLIKFEVEETKEKNLKKIEIKEVRLEVLNK
jgi:hypothetical protein